MGRYSVNSLRVRRIDPAYSFCTQWSWLRCKRCGFFQIGRIRSRIAIGDNVLTRLGEHMKFMGIVSANIARIRLHGAKFQFHPGQDAFITAIHLLVGCIEAGLVQMKGICVLHCEFPRAHYTESGSTLVAKLGLNLIKVDG